MKPGKLQRSKQRCQDLCSIERNVELASSTLRSIALNYIQRSSPNPPKALVKALNGLKKPMTSLLLNRIKARESS